MNAYGEVASSAESPSAASKVWMTLPAVMPSAAAIPARAPTGQTAAEDEKRVLPRREDEDHGRGDEQPVVVDAEHGRECIRPDGLFLRPDGHVGNAAEAAASDMRLRL